MRDDDRRIAQIAQGQGGHITHEQLVAIGLARGAIAARIKRGLLIRVYHGVYAVGRLASTNIDRAHGALLACGPRSALSHSSAGALYGIYKRWQRPLEVTIAGDRRPRGIRVHHSAALKQTDIHIVEGVRVTSPARTLLDNAPRLPATRRTRAFNDLRLIHDLEPEDVHALIDRFPRHPGAKLLRPLLDKAQREPTRSELEDAFERLAAKYGLPPYVLNGIIEGYRVDVLFAAERLIVELDGYPTHKTRLAFERDRRQDADILAATGIPTIRLTYDRTTLHAAETAEQLHTIIERRRRELAAAA